MLSSLHPVVVAALVAGTIGSAMCSAQEVKKKARKKDASATKDAPPADAKFKPVKLHGGFTFTEGPAADKDGNVYFTDVRQNRIHRIDLDGKLSTFMENTEGANGLMFDAKGRLIACQGTAGKVIAIDVATKKFDVLAEEYNGGRFNAPNDLAVDSNGGVYFTDPMFRQGDPPQDKECVYFIPPGGKPIRIVDDQPRPNGTLLAPDGKTLYVLLSGKAALMAYPVEAPGKIGPGKSLGDVLRSGDGLSVDTAGNLYLTQPSHSQIQILSPTGKTLGRIAVPEGPANCAFGGKSGKTLFITARTSVYTVDLDAEGYWLAKGK